MLKGFFSYTTSDMKIFHCDHCGHLLFFENTECLSCGHRVAYLPDVRLVGSLDADGADTWRSPLPRAAKDGYRLCHNDKIERVCNWAVPASDDNPLCLSCRTTRVIPNLAEPGNRSAWYRLEVAKRRLLFSLMELGLPIQDRSDDSKGGLAFEFLADAIPGAAPVLTGHENGVITVNIAEADDAERERRRAAMHEGYRTLLGHMRHESGHFYWDRLIGGTLELDEFRSVFGDERADYAAALSEHYARGGPADWQERFVSAYAASHPWEDWAETWAHYMHIVDTLETAYSFGLSVDPQVAHSLKALKEDIKSDPYDIHDFETIIRFWLPLTFAMNSLNRSMGLSDLYPFVISGPVKEKMKFIHQLIMSQN